MNKITYFFKQQFQSIRNLIVWFPIIWKNREWDDYYFFVILDKKLREMGRFYRSKKANHLYAYKDADNIHYCVERTQRILANNYLTEALRPFHEKYPDYSWKMEFKELDNGMNELVDNDTDEQTAFFRECAKKSDEMLENDLDELFAQLRIHIQDWWD